MLSLSEVRKIYTEMKSTNIASNLSELQEDTFHLLTEYFCSKFQETLPIFSKFDSISMLRFCQESSYSTFEENMDIFKKGEECSDYYFLIYGDINLYDEEFSALKSNKLLKTLSAGSVYGHKIKLNFNFYAVAKNTTHLVKIQKKIFDGLIEETNIRKENFKNLFLKKFFPKFRMYSDDLIKTLKGYFIREQYEKNAKIIMDNEFDEYVYIVIKGSLGLTKGIKRIKHLRETLTELNLPGAESIKSVMLEKMTRGDIFGVYSALKHQKNNYTVTVLSEKAEIYKISKSHCLFYFGGSSGVIPEALKGLDSVQQVSLNYKLDFLEKCKIPTLLEKFHFIHQEINLDSKAKKPVDESEITNVIKDSWKDLENLGSKISEFKNSLLKPGVKTTGADIFAKLKSSENEVEMKDNTKLMGFATNRIVSKNLNKTGLSSVQMKGMSTLQNICGVKKTDEKIDQNALLKITALKNLEPHKKSKLLSDLDELPAKQEIPKVEKIEKVVSSSDSTEDKKVADDAVSTNSASTANTSSTSSTNSISAPSTTAAPKKKMGFSLKSLI